MSTAKPQDWPWIVPMLTVQNGKRAIDFYKEAFGFELGDDPMTDDDGNVLHAAMRYNDCQLMIGAEDAFDNPAKAPKTLNVIPSTSLYIYCDNVDELFNHAKSLGAEVLQEPEDMFWGDRMCKLADADGHVWAFATKIQTM